MKKIILIAIIAILYFHFGTDSDKQTSDDPFVNAIIVTMKENGLAFKKDQNITCIEEASYNLDDYQKKLILLIFDDLLALAKAKRAGKKLTDAQKVKVGKIILSTPEAEKATKLFFEEVLEPCLSL